MEFTQKLNTRTGQFNLVPVDSVIHFKPGVATAANLPPTGNDEGDARITADTGHLYIWSGSAWVDQGDIIDIDWSAITGKPTSTPANIDDAVSKRHTQNTDTSIMTSGSAPTSITGDQIKTAVDNEHTHSNKTELDLISGTNTGDETITSLGTKENGATSKITPVDADNITLLDSAPASGTEILKKLSWSNIKSTLKSYFDALYTLANLGGVPTSRTVNGHALSGDVSVTLGDVGGEAAGTTSTHAALTQTHGITGSGNRIAGLTDITKVNVGLGNVTDDAQLKASQLSTDGALGTDDTKVPSQKAVKTYADTKAGVTRATFANGDLSTGVLTITHNKALSAPYTVFVAIFDNNGKQIIPDEVTGATNSVAIDLTSFGTLSGTWGYILIA